MKIEDGWPKTRALVGIAGKHTEAGLTEKATQVLSQALQTAKKIEDGSMKSDELAAIAEQYAGAGQTEKAAQVLLKALEAAMTIEGLRRPLRSPTLVEIAIQFAKAEQFIHALETAKNIDDESAKSRTIARIAIEFAEAGQFVQALATTMILKDEGDKSRTLAQIASQVAGLKDADKSFVIVHVKYPMEWFWEWAAKTGSYSAFAR
jgi:hypothetical protein